MHVVCAFTHYAKKNNVHWVSLKQYLLMSALECGRDLNFGMWGAVGCDASGLLGSQALNAY